MPKIKPTSKMIRYTIVLEASPSDTSELEQALESLRGFGTAEIVDVEIAKEEKDAK